MEPVRKIPRAEDVFFEYFNFYSVILACLLYRVDKI